MYIDSLRFIITNIYIKQQPIHEFINSVFQNNTSSQPRPHSPIFRLPYPPPRGLHNRCLRLAPLCILQLFLIYSGSIFSSSRAILHQFYYFSVILRGGGFVCLSLLTNIFVVNGKGVNGLGNSHDTPIFFNIFLEIGFISL